MNCRRTLLVVLALLAAALPAVSQVPAGLPDDVTAALRPLYGASADYSPPSADVADLPAGLDPLTVLALRQLNTWRASAGLAPYRYDERLAKMAIAHVRYARASSQAGLAWSGHFELASQPGYSKEGHEAASTSGIAYGDADLYSALDGLMAGPYHRMQFLRPEEVRVGAGYGSWEGQGNSIGLFVTRGPSGTAAENAPRFVLFPPPDSRGIGVSFDGENPDPRPGFQGLARRPTTGYPVTISLSWNDTKAFTSAEVTVTDPDGTPVPCWVTDPAHPSTTTAPRIYGPGVSAGDAFARNFDAVFIMPRAPLRRGTTYAVKARLAIGSEASDLSWSFTTSPAVTWKVSARPAAPWNSLAYAAARAVAGDTIQLEEGTYWMSATMRLRDVHLSGAGPDRTRLRFPNAKVMPVVADGAVVIERLSLDHPGQVFYQPPGSTLLLEQAALTGGDGQAVVSTMERGSTLALDKVNVSAFDTYYLCYAETRGSGGAPRVLSRGVTGLKAQGKLVYGTADVRALP